MLIQMFKSKDKYKLLNIFILYFIQIAVNLQSYELYVQ